MNRDYERLAEIANMRNNWTLEAEGVEPPSDTSLEVTKTVVTTMHSYLKDTELYIYPSMEGGISVEWDNDKWSSSLCISQEGQVHEFLSVNVENREYISNESWQLTYDFEKDFNHFLALFNSKHQQPVKI